MSLYNTNMKSKGTNTFRYKSFSDRINEIDIRKASHYHIGHEYEEQLQDADETAFSQTLRKWSVLNLTEEYGKFYKSCQNIITLPQLIYKKEFVVDLFATTLATATTLSLQPVLETLIAFARDLREEFYPFFERIFEKLVALLHTEDPDQFEWTLKCLAHLFKSLRPFLKRNIDVVLSQIVPLLDNATFPENVVVFAAECFSFVARDIKDYDRFVFLTIKNAKKYNNGITGCGSLFFQLIRGVNGNFHTVAGDFLRVLFDCFRQPKYEKDLLFEIVVQTVSDMLGYIQPCNMLLFWNVIVDAARDILDGEPDKHLNVLYHLQLIKRAVEWKQSRSLVDSDQIVGLLVRTVDQVENEAIHMEVSSIASIILLSDHVKISQMNTSRLIRKILGTFSENVFENFVWNICIHPQFEILVLPEFIEYFEKNLEMKRLDLLVKLIYKRTKWTADSNWTKHSMAFKSVNTYRWLEQNIENFNVNNSSTECLEKFLLSTVLYQHLNGGNPKLISGILKKKIEAIIKSYNNGLAIVLFFCTESLLHIDKDIEESFLIEVVTSVLDVNSTCVHTLRTLIAVFEYAKTTCEKLFTTELFLSVQCNVSNNLSANNRILRLLSSRVLAYFAILKEVSITYKIIYDIESITPAVQTYREQLLLLQKLSPSGQFYKALEMDEVKSDCLKFILGLLYHNFKLIWDPILKLIEEYAAKLSVDHFWTIYKRKLEETAGSICSPNKPGSCETAEFRFQYEAARDLYQKCCLSEDKTDFSHYRNLLWKAMPTFGQIPEIKNRDIVNLFLDFVNQEYRKSEESNILTLDEEDEAAMQPSKKYQKPQPVAVSLATMLEIFTKMANPKQLYRERELNEFYLELLSSTNEQLQKLSLDCLLRYKTKSYLAYKDHLYALIDDKKFKDELVNFKLDTQSNMIKSEHRADVMPILLRILYGKMRSKSNNKYIGSQMRRGIVMRFLAGCESDEISWFLKMAFADFEDILKEDCEAIPSRIKADFNLNNVWSPKKLRSALNLLELIRKNFGGLMTNDFLIYMTKIIFLIGSICKDVFENCDKIDEKFLPVFKNLRSSCLLSLVNFFDHFQDFVWESQHVRVLLDIFVWPTLDKLPHECIHSPTPLLKLLEMWSKNPRHYLFLAEKRSDGATPLGTTMSLLVSDKPKLVIKKTIMEMIERLLSIEESDEGLDGVTIVKPHVSQILVYLGKALSAKGNKKTFNKMNLFILSRITEMDLTADVCDTLLKLVLPIAVGKTRKFASDESTSHIVPTLQNLLVKIQSPENHIRSLAPLFEKINDVNTRKQLCALISRIAREVKSRVENLEETANIVENLNAWNRKWVEQPDYDRRLAALRNIKEKMGNNNIDMDLGLLVIYNCFYFLHHDKDMGLRDSASECVRSLVPKLVQRYEGNSNEINYFIGEVMLDLVHRTLRDKNDIIRNEGIQLLGEMARNCTDSHPVLRDLSGLANKQDAEVDFFENITHLQLHRHGRALLKFCTIAKTYEKPVTSRTLTQFILPLATRYLMNEKFTSKHTLIDAAIEAIGMVCRLLPWHQYHTILKYYLNKMRFSHEHHKQCVRILISILDAFHFDLTNSKETQKTGPAVKSKEHERTATDEDKSNVVDEKIQLSDEDLDSKLNEISQDESEDEENNHLRTKKMKMAPYSQRLTQLSPSAAKHIIHTITSNLIPSLNRSITELSSYESKHKLNRRKVNLEREEEESLRVPIAFAIVKLLQKLPKQILEASIQGVFMKVCTFLKSSVKSVRMLTRDMLKKIMSTIGSEYLPMLLSQMTAILTKGFQVHVLSVTLYSVLDCLKDDLHPDDIEKSLQCILNVSLNDIFGEASAEKEIEKIGAHTPEAKPSAKSFLSLHIVARNIPENCLLDMLLPFKQQLYKTQSKKILGKIQECFQKISSGIAENKNIPCESLLEFIFGIVAELIPDLISQETRLSQTEKETLSQTQPNCLLIQPEPKSRSGAVRKIIQINARTNAHVLIEFGLELLHIILRRKKLQSSEYLNPLIPILERSLKGQHVRVSTFAIKCLISIWTAEYKVATLEEYVDRIVKQIFVILHKYFSFGVTRKDDNFQLVKTGMKAVGCVLRKYDSCNAIDKENMAQLLFYIGQDINESDKQPMAFFLLRTLIEKQAYSTELHEIMQKLCEIAITSESEFAREESRVVLLNYITEFYREKKVESILKFFIAQLNVELIAGRLSAVKFINAVIKKYPIEVLNKKAELIFLALGTRLVNDDVPECRILTADCIEFLISRLDNANRQKLFDIATAFFNGEKPAVREMAAVLCSRFVKFEKNGFLSKAIQLLPILTAHLSSSNPNCAGRFVKVSKNHTVENNSEEGNQDELVQQANQRVLDHEIIQTQNCIMKIFEHCPEVLSEELLSITIDNIAYESQRLLAHEHQWVRLHSVKIINAIVSTYDFESVLNGLLKSTISKQFIYSAPESDVKSLALDLCAQMVPGETGEEIAIEISKCLMYIAYMLKSAKANEWDSSVKLNLHWLLRRIRYIIQGEVAKAPQSIILRKSLFDWIEGIVAMLDTDALAEFCPGMIAVLIREISEDDINIDAMVKQKAMRICNKIRKKIGEENYDRIRMMAVTKLIMKRAARKKNLAQEKMLDPVRSAKRKASQQDRKKIAKRKRIDTIRGKGVVVRKKKRKNLDDDF